MVCKSRDSDGVFHSTEIGTCIVLLLLLYVCHLYDGVLCASTAFLGACTPCMIRYYYYYYCYCCKTCAFYIDSFL